MATSNIDPLSVNIAYNPKDDSVTVRGPPGVSFDLRLCDDNSNYVEEIFIDSQFAKFYVEKKAEPAKNNEVSTLVSMNAAVPSGAYCGTYELIATIRATVLSLTLCDLSATIFGIGETCNNEAAKFDATTNIISFPNVNAPSDCLGGILRGLSVIPDSIVIKYDPTADVLDITYAPADVTLTLTKKCSFEDERNVQMEHSVKLLAEEPHDTAMLLAEELQDRKGADPKGAYCGTYLEIVTIRATVLSLMAVKLDGYVFGFAVNCVDEDVAYDNNTFDVKFPQITAPADCLGKLLTSYGLDPNSLSGHYDPAKDTLAITVESVTLTLAQCTSEQLREKFVTPDATKFQRARMMKMLKKMH